MLTTICYRWIDHGILDISSMPWIDDYLFIYVFALLTEFIANH